MIYKLVINDLLTVISCALLTYIHWSLRSIFQKYAKILYHFPEKLKELRNLNLVYEANTIDASKIFVTWSYWTTESFTFKNWVFYLLVAVTIQAMAAFPPYHWASYVAMGLDVIFITLICICYNVFRTRLRLMTDCEDMVTTVIDLTKMKQNVDVEKWFEKKEHGTTLKFISGMISDLEFWKDIKQRGFEPLTITLK